jgi:hypothetical protein
MSRPALVLILFALGTAACTVEHRTVVVAPDDACARYGFTASSADYARCQQLVAEQRRAGRVVWGYSDAEIAAASRAACASYGLPPASALFERCIQDEFAARRPG